MKVFIGSSTEHIHIAEQVESIIKSCGHTAILWKGYFSPGEYTFTQIMNLCNVVDCGIFILAPDDPLITKNGTQYATRDNVLIEAGVLFGQLGKKRVALCRDNKAKLPTDWQGITYIPYEPNESNRLIQEISDWLRVIEKLNLVNDSVVHLTDRFPNIEELLSSANEEIMMSSFFIHVAQISTAFKKAASDGVKMRLVIADYWGSNFMATATMLDGLGTDGERAKGKLRNSLKFFADQKERGLLPDNIEIRSIDYTFPNRATIIDPNTEHGSMYVHISSYENRNAPKATFCLKTKDRWFDLYRQEFEQIWKASKPLDFTRIATL